MTAKNIKRKPKVKPRKPRQFQTWWIMDAEGAVVHGLSGRVFYGVEHIRAIAKWLLKAADYLGNRNGN